MKRFVSAMLILMLVLSPVNGFAREGQKLTTEGLIEDVLKGICGIPEDPEFAFEYAVGDECLSGGILQDENGLPVITGGMVSEGECYGVQVSSEGIVVETPVNAMGMHWPDIVELILEELGLDGVLAIRPEDAQTIAGIFEDIAGSVTLQAVSVAARDSEFSGLPAKKYAIRINADRLIEDINAGVPQAIIKNNEQLEDLLKRWSPLIRSLFPQVQSEIDSAQIIKLWNALGLSGMSAGGMTLNIDVLFTGSVTDPWRIMVSGMNMTFEAWLNDGRLQFVLDTGDGSILAFDSSDLEYLLGLLGQLPGYITEEALFYCHDVMDGARRIRFDLDGVCLERQLMTGITKIIAANRDGIDVLLNKYRPWLELFVGEDADISADEIVMALTVMNMNARYYGLSRVFGLYGIISDNIHIDITCPAPETVRTKEPVIGVVAEGEDMAVQYAPAGAEVCTGLRTWPVTVDLSFDTWSFYLCSNETALDIIYENGYGLSWQLAGNYDQANDALNATLSRTYGGGYRYTDTLNIYADTDQIRFYTGDGEVDLRIDILENKAVLSGTADDEEVSGELAWSDGLLRLTVFDGYDVLEATLTYDEDSVGLTVNAAGTVLSAGFTFDDNSLGLEFSLPGMKFSAGIESLYGGFSLNWNVQQGNYHYNSSGELMLTAYTFKMSQSRFDRYYGGTMEINAEACLYPDNVRVDIHVDRGNPYRVRDDFDLTYRPGQLSVFSGGRLLQVNDATPEGSADKNITGITLYDAYAYETGNTEESTVELMDCCTRYELVTEVEEECYRTALLREGTELFALKLDFAPDSAQAVSEEVLWLTPALFRIMYGLADLESADSEMPIKVYAEEEPAEVPEQEATPEPTAEPTPEPTEEPAISLDEPIDGTADAETITQIQMRLYSLGLLSTDGLEEGILDRETLLAIVDFQNKVNERYEAGLTVIDPADPNAAIDTDTLWWLFEKEF